MLKKMAVALLFASMIPVASLAQVVIRVGPPAPIVEHFGPAPRPGYVWVAGYHRWDGNRYVWTPGHWANPPRPHAVWVAPVYEPYNGGYRFHAGYWR